MATAPVADAPPTQGTLSATSNSTTNTGGWSRSAVWERIRLRVEERLRGIEIHAHRLLDRSMSTEETAEAVATAGALASELGRLELPGVAQLARHLVSTLSRDRLDAGDAVHIAGTTEDIRTLVSSAIAQQESTVESRGTIVAVGPASVELDGICWVLSARGHRVLHDADRLVETDTAPSGVLFAAGPFTGGTPAILRAIGESWSVPIIALYDDAQPAALGALAARCSTILPLTVSADVVSTEFARFETADAVSPIFYAFGRVPRTAGQLLRAHGFLMRRAPQIDALPGLLEQTPAAVIFGNTAEPVDVMTVARVIRAIPATRRTPIVWLAPDDAGQREQARQLNVVPVDSVTDGIAVRTKLLLRAAEADRMEEEQDFGSILSWPAVRVLTDRSLVAAHRTGGSVVVAALTVDPDLSEEKRTQTLESLSREFRRGDIVGLREDRTVVVVLQGVSRRVATNRLSRLLHRFDLDQGSGRAGVAMFPGDGRSADELVDAAERARETARESGGPPVVSTMWRPVDEQVAEVLIVESDPVLGPVLKSVLVERGHPTEVLESGNAALESMTDPTRTAFPRLLLVDLDASGLDGLSLVRRLRRAGVLAQMSVLLMTARSSESDLRAAIGLGVKEIIRKPFSGTLLLHRVGRLLEDH